MSRESPTRADLTRRAANVYSLAARLGYDPMEVAANALEMAEHWDALQAKQEGREAPAPWTVTHRGKVRVMVAAEEALDRSGIPEGVRECIRDAEEALNTGAIFADRLGNETLRLAFLGTRAHLREQLGEGRS